MHISNKFLILRKNNVMGIKHIKEQNPFYTSIRITDEYFCDREKETENIISKLKNGTNIVLKSPRRIGKSSLIMHVFQQDEIARNYNTLFVDVLGTKNLDEFIGAFKNAFLEAPFARTSRGRKQVTDLLQRLYLQVGFSPAGTLENARVGLSLPQAQTMTLTEMFSFLEKTSKPNIVVFDEFQKISQYDADAAAVLRSQIQRMNNTRFIFSGSSRHMLDRMFEYPSEPFYRSAGSMDLGPIPADIYVAFCEKMFLKGKRTVEPEAARLAYELLSANTFDMQSLMKETFALTPKGGTATVGTVTEALDVILNEKDQDFRETLDRVSNKKTRRLLFCIANEGVARSLTSSRMIKGYNLDNASSVQFGLKTLTSDNGQLVERIGTDGYRLTNRYLELWYARSNGRLDFKIQTAGKRFELEKMLSKTRKEQTKLKKIPTPNL